MGWRCSGWCTCGEVCVIGDDAVARRLEAVAWLDIGEQECDSAAREPVGGFARALAETLPHLPGLKEEGSFAVVCTGKVVCRGSL